MIILLGPLEHYNNREASTPQVIQSKLEIGTDRQGSNKSWKIMKLWTNAWSYNQLPCWICLVVMYTGVSVCARCIGVSGFYERIKSGPQSQTLCIYKSYAFCLNMRFGLFFWCFKAPKKTAPHLTRESQQVRHTGAVGCLHGWFHQWCNGLARHKKGGRWYNVCPCCECRYIILF